MLSTRVKSVKGFTLTFEKCEVNIGNKSNAKAKGAPIKVTFFFSHGNGLGIKMLVKQEKKLSMILLASEYKLTPRSNESNDCIKSKDMQDFHLFDPLAMAQND